MITVVQPANVQIKHLSTSAYPFNLMKNLAILFPLFFICFGCSEAQTNNAKTMKETLLVLEEYLQEPFGLDGQMDGFPSLPEMEKLLSLGQEGADSLLYFINDKEEPGLARTAMLALSQFDPELYYEKLLSFIENADQELIEPLDAGIWRTKVSEDQVAKDLVRIVSVKPSPYPLLLLQRPAAKHVENELRDLVDNGETLYSRYAAYCLEYL